MFLQGYTLNTRTLLPVLVHQIVVIDFRGKGKQLSLHLYSNLNYVNHVLKRSEYS